MAHQYHQHNVRQNLPPSSSPSSSSFQLPSCAAKCGGGHGGSDSQDMPPVRKAASLGSELKESESSLRAHGDQQTETQSVGGHMGEQREDLSASPNLPVSQPDHQATRPMRPNVSSMTSDSFTIENMPYNNIIPSDQSPPHEDTKLGFTVFAVEILGALSNFAVSASAKEHRYLIYAVVASITMAFIISSTALILHKKRPALAKKMQKLAFLFGAFGFMGILGMHLPPSIMWWFTIPAFLLCLLMFTVATLIVK